MEENKPNQIDQLFKEGLEQAQLTPPPGLWEGIGAQMAQNAPITGASTGILGIKGILVTVSAALIGVAAWYTVNSNSEQDTNSSLSQSGKSNKEIRSQIGKEWENSRATGNKMTEHSKMETRVSAENGSREQDLKPKLRDKSKEGAQSDFGKDFDLTIPSNPFGFLTNSHSGHNSNQNKGDIIIPALGCNGISKFSVVKSSQNAIYIQCSSAVAQLRWETGDGRVYSNAEALHYYNLSNGRVYRIKCWVMNAEGCADSSYEEVNFCPQNTQSPYMANTFTPNGDQINDKYYVEIGEVEQYHMVVLGGGGELLYETYNIGENAGWDGKVNGIPAAEGLYIVKIEYKFPCQQNEVKTQRILLKR